MGGRKVVYNGDADEQPALFTAHNLGTIALQNSILGPGSRDDGVLGSQQCATFLVGSNFPHSRSSVSAEEHVQKAETSLAYLVHSSINT